MIVRTSCLWHVGKAAVSAWPDRRTLRPLLGHRSQINAIITIDISHVGENGAGAHSVVGRALKVPLPLPWFINSRRCDRRFGGDDVGVAVTIKVGNRQIVRPTVHGVVGDRGPETDVPVALVDQHINGIVGSARRGQVGVTVAVKVGQRDRAYLRRAGG